MKRSPFILALVCAGLLAGGQWQIQARADNPPPTRLAVVNLMKLFQTLNEKRDNEADIVGMQNTMNTQKETLEKLVDDDGKALQAYNPDSKGYQDATEKYFKDGMELKAQEGMMEQRLLMEQRLRTMKIYRHINDAIAEYSKEKGIALVLMTEDADLASATSMDQILSKIAMRKILYADSSLDITKELITRMNTAYDSAPK